MFLILQGLLPVLVAFLTKYAIDSVVSAKQDSNDWNAALTALIALALFGSVLFLNEAFQSYGTWLRTAQSEYFGDFISDKIHLKAAEVDLSFYETAVYHNLLEQVRGESGSKPLALIESIGGVVSNGISMLGMGAILLAYGWWVPAALVIGSLPALYLTFRADRNYHDWWSRRAEDRRWLSYYDAMLTHGSAAMEMRLFDLSGRFRQLYQSSRATMRTEKLRKTLSQGNGRLIASAFAMVTAGSVSIWMAFRIFAGLASLGDLGVLYQVFTRGQSIAGAFFQSLGKAYSNSLYLESLFSFLDLEPNVVSSPDAAPPPEWLSRGIEFRSVTFRYPESEVPVIKNFNLFIPANKVVALVGVNGAGKSTLIKLINRFYDPTDGTVEIDGIDLRRFDLKKLRRMQSVLFQFPMQFHATAEQNIKLGDVENNYANRDIVLASEKAGAHSFITQLPNGYETLLGKWFVNGVELSGGEWQRLALARAYFRQAQIVILDEPTSFMDPWSEVDWFDRFREMIKGRTGLVITHRFTIAMRADLIHVMDKGQVVESGTHLELLKLKGSYAKSWDAQMSVAGQMSEEVI